MRMRAVSMLIAFTLLSASADALTTSDSLTTWREGSAMDRMQLATRFGKSFISLNEGFTAEYFLKCIDDISTYGNAKEAKVEDAVRECVAARMRKPGEDDE